MPRLDFDDFDESGPIGFPIHEEVVISPEEAVKAIQGAIQNVENFRDSRVFLFRTIIGALVPGSIRQTIQEMKLDRLSLSYQSIVNSLGLAVSGLIVMGLDDNIDLVRDNQRLILLPFMEIKLKSKIESIKQKKPWGWRIYCRFYEKTLRALEPLIDNYIRLISLGWTFCPGIGEPEIGSGFYNRFVFTCNGGFIDLGHFFNCAIITYLYGGEFGQYRSEKTEKRQRWLRGKKWLTELREKKLLTMLTNMLWGYATSADTIEDRASDSFGIDLGEFMRKQAKNGRELDRFMQKFPEIIRESMKVKVNLNPFIQIHDAIKMFFKNLIYHPGKTTRVDIPQYMQEFFKEYDGLDPKNGNVVPRGLLRAVLDFYTQKYDSPEWDKYTCREWWVVIPQVLWERVVSGRENFGKKKLPIKIQMKDTGELVDPYPPKWMQE